MKKILLPFFIAFLFVTGITKAQLTTTRAGNYGNKTYLVNNILLGSGVTAVPGSVTYQGIDTSYGFFNGIKSDIGMDSGVIITNGTITLAAGPNQKTYGDQKDGAYTTYGYGVTNGGNGGWPNSGNYRDTDLANLIGTTVSNTYSCALLQFDFVATSDSIEFQYSFGSNEEPYYVGSKYVDDFGLFLSGPGITGPFSHKGVNLAVVPGKSTAISIDSVNCTINPAYYVCNWPNSTGCSTCPNKIANTTVGYNGFTSVLTAKAKVQCGKKYHIKIGVADINNGYFDSGVFLKAGSFSPGSGAMTVSPTASTLCNGINDTLTAAGALTYTWSPAGSLNITTGDTVIATPTITTTYTVVGTQVACNDTAYITVTVNNPPSIPVLSPQTICSGTSATITASGATSYTWSPNTGLSSTTGASVNAKPPGTTTYMVTGTSAGCPGNSTQNVTVTVNPTPTVTVTPPSASVCSGNNVNLLASGANTYTWTPSTNLTCTTCASTTASPISTTTYKVVGDALGCLDSTTVTVTIIVTPVTATVTAKPDSVCEGASTTLSVTSSGLTNFLWSTGSTASSISVTPFADSNYFVTAQNICGDTTVSKTVYVIVPPTLAFKGNDSVCANDNDVITVSGASGTNYVWSPASGLNTTTGTSVIANVSKTTTYTVTTTTGLCPGTSTFTVNIIPPPPIKINAADSACQGTTVTLTAVGAGPYTWSNQSTSGSISVQINSDSTYFVRVSNGCADTAFKTIAVISGSPITAYWDTTIEIGGVANITATGAISYVWSPSGSLSCSTCASTKATPDQTTTYTVTGTNAHGCFSTDTVTVDIACQDFYVPNVFTPNNDGQNDVFLVKAYSVEDYSIEIFNRWGEQVFKSDSPYVPWDGKDNSGVMVSDGVYYYIILSKCNGKDYNHHGFVQVIK